MFYKAMGVFVRKHYSGTKAGIFTASIYSAIWIRAVIAAISKFLKWIGLPVIDALLILLSFFLAKEIWIGYFLKDVVSPGRFVFILFPSFALVYLLVAYYAGLYDKYYRTTNLLLSIAMATIFLLAIYGLLPERFRFSIGIMVPGALLSFMLISVVRIVLIRFGILSKDPGKISKPYILIAGTPDEFQKVKSLLQQKELVDKIAGYISVNGDEKNFISNLNEAKETTPFSNTKEIIFCAGHLPYKQIIDQTQRLKKIKARFFAGNSIIGSDDNSVKGEIFSSEAEYKLAKPGNRRLKRLIDVFFSFFSVLTFPLNFLFVGKPILFLKNCLLVLTAKRTWVGYNFSSKQLPRLKKAVLAPNGIPLVTQQATAPENLKILNEQYAREYEPLQDLIIIFKNYRYLGG
jgi:hypothetical protein